MLRIAFFWIGKETIIPQSFVESIRLIYDETFEVIQLSDLTTPEIPKVSKVIRGELSNDIMLARLQAYSLLKLDKNYTFFCDADSLLINPLVINSTEDILLTPRLLNFRINPNFPEHYPEFVGKMISDVMPFLFGALAVKVNNHFFDTLFKICEVLPSRFHRWYGDQVALANAISNKLFSFNLLEPELHLNIMKSPPTEAQLKLLKDKGVQLITFKGPDSAKEVSLPFTLNLIKNLINH